MIIVLIISNKMLLRFVVLLRIVLRGTTVIFNIRIVLPPQVIVHLDYGNIPTIRYYTNNNNNYYYAFALRFFLFAN